MTVVRRGVTLVELVVVLLLLAILAGIAGLTHATARPLREANAQEARLEAARDSATRSGRRVTITLRASGRIVEATALPDGRLIADSALSHQVDVVDEP